MDKGSLHLALDRMRPVLEQQAGLDFSVLVGSRALGNARPDSDWDIAIAWAPGTDWLERVARTEVLRRDLAESVDLVERQLDLIDLASSNLAMRAATVEDGLPIHGEDTSAWARFLRRTWRELEDYYWDRAHAA
jgi:predicted nucleotidyltransferase